MNKKDKNLKKAPSWLIKEVTDYIKKNGGYLYAPLPHPDFSSIPSRRACGRNEIIEPFLDPTHRTALDIGMHLGNECHFLEDHGYEVIGIEFDPFFARIAREVRDLCNKKFTIYEGNLFEFDRTQFDVIFALNIFHHFIKTPNLFQQLDTYLSNLNCKAIFFQSSNPSESQMLGSHKNYSQDEFAQYIQHKLNLPNLNLIGIENNRNIYHLH